MGDRAGSSMVLNSDDTKSMLLANNSDEEDGDESETETPSIDENIVDAVAAEAAAVASEPLFSANNDDNGDADNLDASTVKAATPSMKPTSRHQKQSLGTGSKTNKRNADEALCLAATSATEAARSYKEMNERRLVIEQQRLQLENSKQQQDAELFHQQQ